MTAQRKLIVLDVDSTLTQDEGIDLLARYVSDEAATEVSNITALAMAGKLDFAASLTARVQALAGLSLDDVSPLRRMCASVSALRPWCTPRSPQGT